MELSKYRGMVDQSTSAWFKSIMDPAHAREYGCSGIPDENKMPTIVSSNRDTFTITSDSVPKGETGSTFKWYTQDENNSALKSFTASTVLSVTVASYASPYSLLVTYEAYGVGLATGDIPYSGRAYCGQIYRTSLPRVYRPARYVSGSITADVIGQLMFTGGYFETGYVPPYPGTTTSGATVNFVSYPVGHESTYATRVCKYDLGCYSVHRMSNYDFARIWRTDIVGGTVYGSGLSKLADGSNVSIVLGETGKFEYLNQPNSNANSGYDPMFVKYYPSGSTNWVLRVTYSYQLELQTPFNEGGTDGAKYDEEAVKAYMQIADSVDFLYPSSYNDLKRLISNVKGVLAKNKAPIKALVGGLPYGSAVNAVMDVLLDWDRPAQKAVAKGRKAKNRVKRAVQKATAKAQATPTPAAKGNPFLRKRK